MDFIVSGDVHSELAPMATFVIAGLRRAGF